MIRLYIFLSIFFTLIEITAQVDSATTVVTGLESPIDLAIKDDYLFILHYDNQGHGKISRINLTDTTPVAIDLFTSIYDPGYIAINENFLFFVEGVFGEVFKIDLTKDTAQSISVVSGLNEIYGMAFNGDDLYLVEKSFSVGYAARIVKIDVSTTNPIVEKVKEMPFSYINDMFVKGDDLYYISDYQLVKVDLTDTSKTFSQSSIVHTFSDLLSAFLFDQNDLYVVLDEHLISEYDILANPPSFRRSLIYGLNKPSSIVLYGTDIFIAELDADKVSQISILPLSVGKRKQLESKIEIYPNPATDFVRVKGITKLEEYSVYSYSGSLVKSGIVSDRLIIDIGNISDGMYLIKVGNSYAKLIVKK